MRDSRAFKTQLGNLGGVPPWGCSPPEPGHPRLWLPGSGLLEGSGICLPEDAAREEDLVLHLVGGGAGDLHAVLVLLLQLVAHVVGLGDVAPVVNLETERAVSRGVHRGPASLVTSSPPGARTLDLHLGFPSGSVMVPPYSMGTWSALIYFSKTSFQFAGRGGKEGERRVTTVYTKEAGKRRQPAVPLSAPPQKKHRHSEHPRAHSTFPCSGAALALRIALSCPALARSEGTWVPIASGQVLVGVR